MKAVRISRRTRQWDHSGVPLGGIGAGKIEFCPSGRFSNVTTQNNWDAPVSDAKGAVLKPTYDPVGIPGAFLAVYVEGSGALVLKDKAPEGMKGLSAGRIDFRGQLPRAVVRYPTMSGVGVQVEAWSSLVLDGNARDHYRDAALPAAVFHFHFTNRSAKTKQVSALVSWQNLVGQGGFAGATINDLRQNTITYRGSARTPALEFSGKFPKASARVDGTYTLMTQLGRGDKVSYLAGYHPGLQAYNFLASKDFWPPFEADGRLTDTGSRGGSGALAVSCRLRSGQSRTVPLVLAWWFPHLVASDYPEIDYGHAYENWFHGSADVARYVLKNRRRLYARTLAWQKLLEDSNLPAWLVEKLCNDLFSLYANAWYTRDYRHTVNESPTDMHGCAGTIDQRSAASAVYDMCLPALSRAELMLFASQQIDEKSPLRYDVHWDHRTGTFSKRIDRLGAIRHDVGWDHIEGGHPGAKHWTTLCWPDLTSVFVLESLRYFQWTGDHRFLHYVYPRVKRALEFQHRLDANGDGIAEVWGPGSNTYDSPEFTYFGASSFIASLYLAALLAGERFARAVKDADFARLCLARCETVRANVERTLWNPERGHFNMWVDTLWRNWSKSERPHGPMSDSCMIAQCAGQWYSHLLGLIDTVNPQMIESSLNAIDALNVRRSRYCPANEVSSQGKVSYSWIQYIETYYAALAIYEGLANQGLEAVKRIYRAQYARDGSPWNTPLKWEGPGNSQASWGRWYMTNPASWFLLQSITGVGVDMIDRTLTLSPSVPAAIGRGRELRGVPVFFPTLQATVDFRKGDRNRVTLKVVALPTGPVRFSRLLVGRPGVPTARPRPQTGTGSSLAAVQLKLNRKSVRTGEPEPATDGRHVAVVASIKFVKPGDVLECTVG